MPVLLCREQWMACERTQVEICKVEAIGHFDSKHSRHSIYSVDIQPTKSAGVTQPLRLATAGGDGSVKIWDVSKIEVDVQGILLASLETHTKSVNIVRWNSDGTLLASGSDDTYVIVYRLVRGGSGATGFGSQHKKNKENWLRFYTMRGHTMDVLDLSWSPREVIASGSIDNKVIIWGDVDRTLPSAVMRTPKRVLSGHKSFVKGVAFDPTGRFLASCCSNNVLIVWDASEWTQVVCLTGPMSGSPDQVIFRRLSWAPDGDSLCLSSACKSERPVGMVLKRGTWESVADLVGHDAQSCSARFSPHVLSSAGAPSLCTVALGDQAGVLSFWASNRNTPFLVLRDCFEVAVTDISWTMINGARVAVAASLDGSVVFVSLSGDGLSALSSEQLDTHFMRIYGEGVDSMRRAPEALVDDPRALQYLSSAQGLASELSPPPEPSPGLGAPVFVSDKSVLELQQVSRAKNGKKRIRPVVEFSAYDAAPAIQPEPSGAPANGAPSEPIVPPSSAEQVDLPTSSPLTARSLVSANGAPANGGVAANGLRHAEASSSSSARFPRPAARGGAEAAVEASILEVSFSADKAVHSLSRLRVDERRSVQVKDSPPRGTALVLAVQLMSPPSALLAQKSQRSLLTVVALADPSRQDESLWSAIVLGEATAYAACRASADSSAQSIAAIGCFDGSLNVLSLDSGTRLFPPLLLGLAVAHIDVQSDAGTAILAVTVDGEVWNWRLTTDGLTCVFRANVRPLMQSMKCRLVDDQKQPPSKKTKASEVSAVVLERCYYAEDGRVVACVRSIGAPGGDYQVFAFCPLACVWMRLADLRHVMSRYCA